jgi:UDP-N-acetylmuramyl-tripeptide synthetase/UDP-N-acetylmuramoyl-tripeptide--D-alanyl-D-alanine ligase
MVTFAALVDILKKNQLWIASRSAEPDMAITGKPVTDSRLIRPGDTFVCIRGLQSDGHNFIRQARETGAGIIITENDFTDDLPSIRVSDSRKAAAILGQLCFCNPSGKFTLIGVTGTNGKTTTSMLIRQALLSLGKKVGWIGTLGYIVDSDLKTTNNTTPDIIELNNIFNQMVTAGSKYVVMEVSSHALALDRVFGLEFDIAVFTNLSREHLDFHKDMEDYFESKYKLFEYVSQRGGLSIINIDDSYGRIIRDRLNAKAEAKVITVSEQAGDITILSGISNAKGSEVRIRDAMNRTMDLTIGLAGHFNMLNAVMAIVTLEMLIPSLTDIEIKNIAKALKPVRGRLEQVINDRGIGVYIDYAHTPDAMRNVLSALSGLEHKRIITVFGAGGNRDKGKRPEMLTIAMDYSEAVIITDDNPRTEPPGQIIKDIVGQTDMDKSWWVIRDRNKAIRAALLLAKEGDLVLIAGKGHETYQEVNGLRHHFDDREVAGGYLSAGIELHHDELVLPIDPVLLEILYDSDFRASRRDNKFLTYISTDSRTIKPESLYFALKGENFDGMNFVEPVLADESNAAVISNDIPGRENVIVCHNVQKALGMLAKKYLQMFAVRKIALTGSTGKTTTKEFMANIFAETGSVLKTFANENNIIGLSKTIFGIRPFDKTSIFELGTNHFGEIAELTDICKPEIAVITNIGPSHLEFLKDEAGVFREKIDLFKNGAETIIYPGDDMRFTEFKENGTSVGYSEQCDYRIEHAHKSDNRMEFLLNGQNYNLNQLVPFYVQNAAFAITVADKCSIPHEVIQKGILNPLELQNRMELHKIGGVIIINDCYNANPVSMTAAIDYWKSIKPDKPHLAILGDMLELGSKAEDYHKRIGKLLDIQANYNLITVGELSRFYHNVPHENPIGLSLQISHYSTIDALLTQPFLASPIGEMVVLIKGSHGIHLEKVLPAIKIWISQLTEKDHNSSKEF